MLKEINVDTLFDSIEKNKSMPVYLQIQNGKKKHKAIKYACLKTTTMMVLLPDDLEHASICAQTSSSQKIIADRDLSTLCKQKNTGFFQADHPKPTYGTVKLDKNSSWYLNRGTNEQLLDNKDKKNQDRYLQEHHNIYISEKSILNINSQSQNRNKSIDETRKSHTSILHIPLVVEHDSDRLCSSLTQFNNEYKKRNSYKGCGLLKSIAQTVLRPYNKTNVLTHLRNASKVDNSNTNRGNHISKIREMKYSRDRDYIKFTEESKDEIKYIPGFSFKVDKPELKVDRSNSTMVEEDCLIKLQEEQRLLQFENYRQPFTITNNELISIPLRIYEISSINQEKFFGKQ